MNQVLIHFDKGAREHLNILGLKYQESDGELNAIVDDIPYEVVDGFYQDPDIQFCDKLGIDYDYVNCIEAYESCAI